MENRCPICHKIVAKSSADSQQQVQLFPFCSNRCKLVDLGAWFDGSYKVVSRAESQENQSLPENSEN